MNINEVLPDGRLTMLIDADIYLFRACASTEVEHDWGDDVWSLVTDLKESKNVFRNTISQFQQELDIEDFVLCISDSSNFRKLVLETYKGNRKGNRKPCGYKALVDWAKEEYPHVILPGLEADDVMGILQTTPGKDTYTVSDDKDMMTIPGRLYQPQKALKLNLTLPEANEWFYRQALTGDAVDGYSGIKGVGPKKADAIVAKSATWRAVEAEYLKNGYTQAEALQQARCARICRSSEYDLTTDTLTLWNPNHD